VEMIASEMARPAFWLAALQIMGINILLSGDNAVVIALACRGLPPKERFWGMVFGAGVAAILLILFTGIVATLLKLPFLKLVGGLALFWVAIKLVAPQSHDAEDTPEAVQDLWRAVRVVVVANIVMSLDNVIAVAAAAKGNYLLLGLGLAVSIPVVIAGSALFLAVLERFPIVVWGGGALLGWIAGGLIPEDPMVMQFVSGTTTVGLDTTYNLFGNAGQLKWDFDFEVFEVLCGILGAIIVVAAGLHLQRGARTRESEAVVDMLTHGANELAHGAKELHGTQPVGAKD
jgi:YjbE family integral membrane protein